MTEHEMEGWHHRLSGREFEQATGEIGGRGSLGRCSPRGRKESCDKTERLNSSNGIYEDTAHAAGHAEASEHSA